jgi:hypothetical protein
MIGICFLLINFIIDIICKIMDIIVKQLNEINNFTIFLIMNILICVLSINICIIHIY